MRRLCLLAWVAAVVLMGTPPDNRSAAAGPTDESKPRAVTPEEQQRRAGDELALVEEVAAVRKRYLDSLEKLAAFYTAIGDKFKLDKAKEELAGLRRVTQPNYLIVAEALAPDIRPSEIIPEADKLFQEARRYDTESDPVRKNENKRRALESYVTLISRYPTSTRVAEAAWYAAVIYEEELKDEYSAVIYYQKTYEWDRLTQHPARIKAARLCYYKLKDLARAKKFYDEAMENSPVPAFRAEGKAMSNLLKAWGY